MSYYDTFEYKARKNPENWNAITDKNGQLIRFQYKNPYDESKQNATIEDYAKLMGIGKGGSRRRTVYRKHKSHRKSKRVRHTRRKQTRRHRHSRRR
jgi:hypothetical protein